jgi:glutathione S-transferase
MMGRLRFFAVLKIYGRNNSVNVMKVLWTCGELNLPFAREDIGGQFGGNRDPRYLDLNPNGLVPTIDDNGFILWESNAIVRYLVAKQDPGGLWPLELQRRAEADRWMDWQQTRLNGSVFPRQLIRSPPEHRDPAAIEAATMACIEAFRIADEALGSRRYLGGPEFSMADIPFGACLQRWMELPIERPTMPNLARYYRQLGKRPAYAAHVRKLPPA